MARINMKFETIAASESSDDNDDDDICCCSASDIDSKMPPSRNVPLPVASKTFSLLSSSYKALTDTNENVLDKKLPAATVSACNAPSLGSAYPHWWSSKMRLSRRSLLEESLDEIDDPYVSDPTRHAKRKACHGRLDDDDDDQDGNASDDCTVHQIQMFQSITTFRSAKMPRRCHSMFASVPSSSNSNVINNRAIQYNDQQSDSDDDTFPLPPPLSLFSDVSLSTTTSRTVTDTISSEGLEDDHITDNDLMDDDDTAMQASSMGCPVLQRSSTIKDHSDLATSIEAFRTRLLDQQQQQQQNCYYNHDDEEEYDNMDLRFYNKDA